MAAEQMQRPEKPIPGVVGFRQEPYYFSWFPKLVTSEAGGHIAYVCEGQRRKCVVLDGRAGPLFDGIVRGTLVVRSDRPIISYAAKDDRFRHILHVPSR